MIQAFSHIFNFFNKASPCGDMRNQKIRIIKTNKILVQHLYQLKSESIVLCLAF
jgi:hypothetical protein